VSDSWPTAISGHNRIQMNVSVDHYAASDGVTVTSIHEGRLVNLHHLVIVYPFGHDELDAFLSGHGSGVWAETNREARGILGTRSFVSRCQNGFLCDAHSRTYSAGDIAQHYKLN
jgi:hypothetical protein